MRHELCHLQVHTTYSLLEGFVKIESIFDKVKAFGMNALAITDKNNLFGAVKFFDAAKKAGIKPLLGVQLSVLHPMEPVSSELLFYVKDEEGYQNLSRLLSLAYERDEYRPYVTLADVEEHSAGLIAVLGLKNSSLYEAIRLDLAREAGAFVMAYIGIFSHENLYLALSSGVSQEEDELFSKKIAFSRLSGLKLLAVNEIYYAEREDAIFQELLSCIRNGTLLADKDRKVLDSERYYMHSPEQMEQAFRACPEALFNTKRLADSCKFEFRFDTYHMPRFREDGSSSGAELRANCEAGLVKRYPELFAGGQSDRTHSNPANADASERVRKILERMDYELSVISKMGFEDYFLICEDYVRFAKENGIQVGPGRGSGGGSLLCFLLGITDIDPLEHDLLFERFLNPERLDMPDLDIDFQDDRREEVLNYIIGRYGKDRVAQIITFGTLSARQVIKDVGKALGFSQESLNQISSLVPKELDITIDAALEKSPGLKELHLKDAGIKTLLDYARKLEGLPRHSSIHAAGVLIAKEKLTDLVPTLVKTHVCTQYDMNDVKKLGLVKMDLLSLKKLSIVGKVLELLQENQAFDLRAFENAFDDERTYKLLSSGNNVGIFQLESRGMMQFFSRLKPRNLEDIIIGISIFRPGPSAFIPQLLQNRKHPASIRWEHPLLKPILEKTYGCLVYQEQVIEIARSLAGFSYGRADRIRRAMSKKDREIMEEEKQNFLYGNPELGIPGALANGIEEELAEKIFESIADFAKYAFNKSHAAAYAIIAYRMAYLKANYPKEFMLCLLNSELHSTEKGKLHRYLHDAKNMNIALLPPDAGRSSALFRLEDGGIRYPLSALKFVGSHTVSEIEKLQKQGKFPQTLEAFYAALPAEALNRKSIEALAFSGALDCFSVNIATIIHNFEKMHAELSPRARRAASQISLADFVPMDAQAPSFVMTPVPEYDAPFLEAKMLEIAGVGRSFFHPQGGTNKIYIRVKRLDREGKRYIESLPTASDGFELILFEEAFSRSRKFKNRLALNYDLLCELKEKYGESNIRVEKA